MRLTEAVQERLWVLATAVEPAHWSYGGMDHRLGGLIHIARKRPWQAASQLLWVYGEEPWVFSQQRWLCKNRGMEDRLHELGRLLNHWTPPHFDHERLRCAARLAARRRDARRLAPALGLRRGSPALRSQQDRRLPGQVSEWLESQCAWDLLRYASEAFDGLPQCRHEIEPLEPAR
jgi:hypothetical protein